MVGSFKRKEMEPANTAPGNDSETGLGGVGSLAQSLLRPGNRLQSITEGMMLSSTSSSKSSHLNITRRVTITSKIVVVPNVLLLRFALLIDQINSLIDVH